jgi:hypothetical protein
VFSAIQQKRCQRQDGRQLGRRTSGDHFRADSIDEMKDAEALIERNAARPRRSARRAALSRATDPRMNKTGGIEATSNNS